MEKSKTKKISNVLMIIMIIIQPIIDILRGTIGDKYQVLNISLLEIFNYLIISIMIVITLLNNSTKKGKKYFVILGYIYLLYFILHYINMCNFNSSNFYYNKINFLKETYYIIRTYLQPLILMLCLYFNDIENKYFYFAIKLTCSIIALTILISNIFNISFVSYSIENKHILSNIFTWFTYSGDQFKLLTSKGFFYSANQLSNLTIMMLPILIYLTYSEKKATNYILLLVYIIAMFAIGTRTATIGSLLVILASFIIIVFFQIYPKTQFKFKKTIYIFTVFILVIPIFIYSPLMLEKRFKRNNSNYSNNFTNYGISGDESINQEIDRELLKKNKEIINADLFLQTLLKSNKTNLREGINFTIYLEHFKLLYQDKECSLYSEGEKNLLTGYMNHNNYFHRINKIFLDIYPVDNDFEFWCSKFKRNSYENVDSRKIKTEILERAVLQNNNKYDYIFGIGYSSGFPDTERDYYQQFYLFGLFGIIILLFPYILCTVYCIYMALKNYKEKFTIENIFLIFGSLLGFAVAYFGGHFFGKLFVTIIFASIQAINLKNIKGDMYE